MTTTLYSQCDPRIYTMQIEIDRLRNAAEMAKSVLEKLERGGLPQVLFSEVIGALRRSLQPSK